MSKLPKINQADRLQDMYEKENKTSVHKENAILVKSPLRYPGGKSRATPQIIDKYIPKELPSLCSPFVGGGLIELTLAGRGTKVHAYDALAPLVRFWQALLENAPLLADKVRKIGKYLARDVL